MTARLVRQCLGQYTCETDNIVDCSVYAIIGFIKSLYTCRILVVTLILTCMLGNLWINFKILLYISTT